MKKNHLKFFAFALLGLAVFLGVKTSSEKHADEAKIDDGSAILVRGKFTNRTAPDQDQRSFKLSQRDKHEIETISAEARDMLATLELIKADSISSGEKLPYAKSANLIHEYLKADGPPEKILTWLESFSTGENLLNPDDLGLSPIASYAVRKLAQKDGPMVANWIDGQIQEDFFDIGRLVTRAASSWVKNDSRAASRWFESHADILSANDTSRLLTQWDSADLGGCLDWIDQQIESQSGLVSGNSIAIMTKNWAADDMELTLNWMSTLPDEIQNLGYAKIASVWVKKDMPEALSWVAKQSGNSDYDAARSYITERAMATDPLAAIMTANDIVDTKTRNAVMFRASRRFYKQDSEAAGAWLIANGYEDLLRTIDPEY